MTNFEIKSRRWFTRRQWANGIRYLSPVTGKQPTIFVNKYKQIRPNTEARWDLEECQANCKSYGWKEVKPSTVIRFLQAK